MQLAIILLSLDACLPAQTFVPPLLPGEMLETFGNAQAANQDWLSMGIRFAGEFDDNALNDNNIRKGNLLTVIEPSIGWSMAAPRAQWTFDYQPGFSTGYPVSIYNSRSQLLDSSLHLTPSKRVQVRIHESLLKAKNAFDQLRETELAPASSVLDRPNNSIFAASQESNEQAGADLSYAMSHRTIIGASASFYRVSYSSALDQGPIGGATSFGTHAFASYQFTRHHWVGFDYNVDDLISKTPRSRSLVQSFLYTDTLHLRPSMKLSFFAGPQRLLNWDNSNPSFFSTEEPLSTKTRWTWASGGDFLWSSARTNLRFGFSRRISDGAGLQGVVQLTTFDAQVRRQLTRRWNAQLLLSGDRNAALVPGITPLSYLSFVGGISRALNQKVSIACQYWHVHETNFSAPFVNSLSNHNRLSVSLVYNLKVPIQR